MWIGIKWGIGTVYTANNGLQALETAQYKKPDIVFTDIRMPVMDGIEFARQLREKDKRVKIIFLTGYDEMDFIRQAFRLSATDYILKPFLVEDIERVVKGILTSLEQEQTADHSRIHAERKIIDNIFKEDTQQAEELIRQFFAMENGKEDQFHFSVIGLYGKSGNPPRKNFFSRISGGVLLCRASGSESASAEDKCGMQACSREYGSLSVQKST